MSERQKTVAKSIGTTTAKYLSVGKRNAPLKCERNEARKNLRQSDGVGRVPQSNENNEF